MGFYIETAKAMFVDARYYAAAKRLLHDDTEAIDITKNNTERTIYDPDYEKKLLQYSRSRLKRQLSLFVYLNRPYRLA